MEAESFRKKFIATLFASIMFLTPSVCSAASYYVLARAQALSAIDPDHDLVQNRSDDGLTFILADAGPVSGTVDVATAQAFASADIASGKLRGSGSITGGSLLTGFAYAQAELQETLSFILPTGMNSATIGFSMSIDGSYTSYGVLNNTYGRISLGNILVVVANGQTPNFTLDTLFGNTLSGQINITGNTTLPLIASIGVGVQPDQSGEASFEFLNTATISLDLPAGVTFTSASGQFLTAVPIPAAAWLLGTSLLGLLGMMRRKSTAD